jgi:hypothetical protein
MKTLLLAALLMAFGTIAYCQQNLSTQNIQWNCNQVLNVTTGMQSFGNEVLISRSNGKVEWKDGSGTVKYQFDVQSTSGTWSDVNVPGSIRFNFQYESQPGFVEITKTAIETTVKISLFMNEDPQVYDLKINSINPF